MISPASRSSIQSAGRADAIKPFSRPTLIGAVELLEVHTQAGFNQMVLRLGLEDEIDSGTSVSVPKKCDMVGRIIVQRSDQALDTLDGSMTLGEAVVREAILFEKPQNESLIKAIDQLNEKFGKGAIGFGLAGSSSKRLTSKIAFQRVPELNEFLDSRTKCNAIELIRKYL